MASLMSSSRYVAVIVVFLLIFNMYLFQRVIRLNTQNETLETSLQTSLPASITSKLEPATVTVTSTVTATTTVSPENAGPDTAKSQDNGPGSTIVPLLAHQAAASFPAKIWHKCGPKGVSDKAQELINQWLEKNPNFRHELLTDDSADQYVRENYAHWPEVLETYMALTVPILKADFLRALILYADGGIWSDLDISDEIPVSAWVPEEFTKDTTHRINVVVGIEFPGYQFTSWTIMAKPHLQHFKAVIEYIVRELKTAALENKVSLSGLTKPMLVNPDVVGVTGPQAITMALLKSVSEETGEDINKSSFQQLKEPKRLGDILVLPQAAFAALQGGMPQDQGPYLVSHHYSGSWKNDAGGEEGQNPPAARETTADS